MKLLQWVVLFLVAFVIAWVLIFTFTQQPFYTQVPVKIFAYQTAPIPMYAYVSGAFGIGLLLGLIIAVYYYITRQAEVFRKAKRIRQLETELAGVRAIADQKQDELTANSDGTKTPEPRSETAGDEQ